MKYFRLLKPDEIECRVSLIKENGLSLLLYKTARTDADLLDETVGARFWENDFKLVDGVLYGGIGVDYEKDGTYTWKWDAGTESNTEAEKGRASDAFKRAGFKHGIGRELYSAPFIWIPAGSCEIKTGRNGKLQCNDDFTVSYIGYNDEEKINLLEISVGNRKVFEFGRKKKDISETPVAGSEILCEQCGKPLFAYYDSSGKKVSAERHASRSFQKFGKYLCLDCVKANEA